MPPAKSKRRDPNKKTGVRVSALVVMDAAILDKAREKARQHDMSFPLFLERACHIYGKHLDRKITVIARLAAHLTRPPRPR